MKKTLVNIKNDALRGAVIGVSLEFSIKMLAVLSAATAATYDACTDKRYNPPEGTPRNEGNSACALAAISIGIVLSVFVTLSPESFISLTGVTAGTLIGLAHSTYKETVAKSATVQSIAKYTGKGLVSGAAVGLAITFCCYTLSNYYTDIVNQQAQTTQSHNSMLEILESVFNYWMLAFYTTIACPLIGALCGLSYGTFSEYRKNTVTVLPEENVIENRIMQIQ